MSPGHKSKHSGVPQFTFFFFKFPQSLLWCWQIISLAGSAVQDSRNPQGSTQTTFITGVDTWLCAARHRCRWEAWSVFNGNKAEINCGKSRWGRVEGLRSKCLPKIRTIVPELICPPRFMAQWGCTSEEQAIYILRMLLFPSHGYKRVLNNSLTEIKR